jgi:hypothetical protein
MTIRNLLKSCAGLAIVASVSATSLPAEAGKSISLPGANLFPEGIAADTMGGLYISSLIQGRILYLAPGSHAPRVFVTDGRDGLMSTAGMMVTPDGKTLYVCNSDIGFGQFSGASKPGLVAFDTTTTALTGRWNFPDGGLCNDLTLTPDGTVLMTDSFKPRILALQPGADELTQWATDNRFSGEGFNLNGITWTNHGVFVVKYNSNELFRITAGSGGTAGAIESVQLSRPLAGPDGIKTLVNGDLLVVEGGGTLARIRIIGLEGVVETVGNNLNVPTTATVIDGVAYVVEGQLDHLPSPGKTVSPPDPFQIKVLDLH